MTSLDGRVRTDAQVAGAKLGSSFLPVLADIPRMEDGDEGSDPDEPLSGSGVLHRRIDPDPDTAEHDVLEIVAELEDVELDQLPPLYNELDHLIEQLFRTPPSNRSQAALSFSYAGHRIKITRSGTVELVAVKESLSEE